MNNNHKPTTDTAAPTLKRRGFLGGLLAAAAGGALATIATPGQAAARAEVALDRAKWAARNHEMVAQMIAEHGKLAAGYQSSKRPYAVFDWDNTSIMNDCEEALLMHQINTLSFKLTPAEFSAITRQNVPPGPFSKDFKNAAGEEIGRAHV